MFNKYKISKLFGLGNQSLLWYSNMLVSVSASFKNKVDALTTLLFQLFQKLLVVRENYWHFRNQRQILSTMCNFHCIQRDVFADFDVTSFDKSEKGTFSFLTKF